MGQHCLQVSSPCFMIKPGYVCGYRVLCARDGLSFSASCMEQSQGKDYCWWMNEWMMFTVHITADEMNWVVNSIKLTFFRNMLLSHRALICFYPTELEFPLPSVTQVDKNILVGGNPLGKAPQFWTRKVGFCSISSWTRFWWVTDNDVSIKWSFFCKEIPFSCYFPRKCEENFIAKEGTKQKKRKIVNFWWFLAGLPASRQFYRSHYPTCTQNPKRLTSTTLGHICWEIWDHLPQETQSDNSKLEFQFNP